jgi:hypothetical protein
MTARISYAAAVPGRRGVSTSRGSPASQAELVIQTCSCPQAGQSMREAIFGKRRNTLGSVSIAVETESPVSGHLIITELMGRASGFVPAPFMELLDRDRLKTADSPVKKFRRSEHGREPKPEVGVNAS